MNNTRARHGETDLPSDPEAGFTLIEMVIAIVLLTMIIGAVSAAFVTSFNVTSATKQRVNASSDAQLIAGFLTRDAQAAGGTDPNTGTKNQGLGVTTTNAFATDCSAPGTSILGLKWIDLATSTTYVSQYSYVATPTGTYLPQQLLRTICSTAGANPQAIGTSVLANNVVTTATGSLSVPAAWCDGNLPPASPSCPTPRSFPNTVSLGVSVNNATQTLTPPFSFVLTANLRAQSNSAPDLGPNAASANLLLLGASGTCPVGGDASIFAQSASFSITIYGSAGLSGCATNLKKDANTFGPVFVSAPGNCNDFPAPCTVVANPFTDPFLARIASGALTAPPSNCSNPAPAVGGNGHWQPGTYPSDPQASVTRTFDPGVYVFCNGLTGDVTANLQGGAIGGTFFYFKGGAFKPGDVQLTPPTSGQYDGIALWQPTANPLEMFFTKSLINITGTVYAPSALIGMKNGSVNINQLIAYAIDGTPGNPDVHIGPPLRVFVSNPPPPGDPLPPGAQNQPYSGAQATAVDGTGVYNNWTISGVTGLGIGSTCDPLPRGTICGTPSASVAPGVYAVTITVHDNDGEVATVTTHITIYAALVINGSLPTWTVNQPGYPANPLTATGGSGGYTWTPVQIAPGLQMDATGTISGTPTQSGTYTPTIKVTDSIGDVKTITPTVTINPLPTITNVVLSGGTAGRIQKNDTIVVTFSQAMNPATVCAGWSGATTLNGIVTVNDGVSPGPPNDNVAVASAGCAGGLKFGTIDLNSFLYVSGGAATFGASGTASTITLNAAATVLTIKLGNAGGGTVNQNTPASAPVYTASPAIKDTTGAGLAVLTFNLPSGKQF